MDENPYQSPKSAPEVESPSEKPPDRHTPAMGCWLLTFFGIYFLLGGLEAVLPGATWFTMIMPCLIAGPVSVAMALWAWRHPESQWVLAVAILLATSWVFRVLIERYLLGIR
ncbi:hypothetical protein ACFL5Q_05610 [Planctomycetota bacterium]